MYRAYRTHLMFVVYKKYFLSFHTFGEYNPCGQSMLHNTAKIGLKQVLIQSLATLLTRSFYQYRPLYIFCIFLFWKTRRNILALTDIIMQVYRVIKDRPYQSEHKFDLNIYFLHRENKNLLSTIINFIIKNYIIYRIYNEDFP